MEIFFRTLLFKIHHASFLYYEFLILYALQRFGYTCVFLSASQQCRLQFPEVYADLDGVT